MFVHFAHMSLTPSLTTPVLFSGCSSPTKLPLDRYATLAFSSSRSANLVNLLLLVSGSWFAVRDKGLPSLRCFSLTLVVNSIAVDPVQSSHRTSSTGWEPYSTCSSSYSSTPRTLPSSTYPSGNGWGNVIHFTFDFVGPADTPTLVPVDGDSANIFVWAVALLCHAAAKNFGGLFACRVFLGICEGAITPGFMLVTSMFYTRQEQSQRVGYWCTSSRDLTRLSPDEQISSLDERYRHYSSRAHSIWNVFHYDHKLWTLAMVWFCFDHPRYMIPCLTWSIDVSRLMIITGIITLIVSGLFWFLFPDSPATAWFLTSEERVLAVERIKVNQAGVENKHFKKEQWVMRGSSIGYARVLTVIFLGSLNASRIPKRGFSSSFPRSATSPIQWVFFISIHFHILSEKGLLLVE